MRSAIKLVTVLSFGAVVSACGAPQPDPVAAPVIVNPEPISTEPVYTGKYK